MIVSDGDIKDMTKLLDAIQVFEDNQIRCKGMSNHLLALREPGNNRAIAYLERLVGKGKLSNKVVGKMLDRIHGYIIAAAKNGLEIHA